MFTFHCLNDAFYERNFLVFRYLAGVFNRELEFKCILNILLVINTMEIRYNNFTSNLRFDPQYMKGIVHVHITDLSPGITIGNMDTTGLRWLSSFFNTPADKKDNCDEHHPLILTPK